MVLRSASIRKKFLLLVAGVAFMVGTGSALYDWYNSDALLRDQMSKRGRYIASNLAKNSNYGVLTEDKPLLTQLIDAVLSASGGPSSDVAGVMIRDGKGQVLAQKGEALKDMPPMPAPVPEEREMLTASGEATVLFRAPVTVTSTGSMAAEFGLGASEAKPQEEHKGGVEVAISKKLMQQQQRANVLKTFLVALALFLLGSAGGWYLTGVWVSPIQKMEEVASAVAKGDLSESLAVASEDELGRLASS